MKRSLFVVPLLACLISVFALLNGGGTEKAVTRSFSPDLVVHEWGTFTSVAGRGGAALDWRPLLVASDLPKFVYTSANSGGRRGSYRDPGKGRLAKVRMETPVIYFYAADEMEVDVKVAFPGGSITEWYPQAGWVNARFESGINWGRIKLLPGEKPDFLREAADSHYYPARETDAVPVQVCSADKSLIEKEKFLFYRGVGDLGLPLTVRLDGRHLIVARASAADEIKSVIVFENRDGRIGFTRLDSFDGEAVVPRPETGKTLDALYGELEKILVGEGLYEKEAKAMIATWKDSWFENGLRVFYVLPTAATERILPLTIAPAPRETVRVMVGRTEIITPEMETEVRRQVERLRSPSEQERREAKNALTKYGRFYEPILKTLLIDEKNAETRAQIEKLLQQS
jgi:hypothetical protein